jgi:hypothetical protein
MRTSSGIYGVKGSVEDGKLALQLDRGSEAAYSVRGTLQKPVVEIPPASAAALKP